MNTLTDLIKELITATSADKIEWHKANLAAAESYECKLGAYTIQVARPLAYLGSISFGTTINILDSNKNTVITASEGQLAKLGAFSSPLFFPENAATQVGPEVSILFDTVRKKLGGTNVVISALFE